tara:strand:- start:72 stop:314 length:243 start_codon:yes stop_codon:yes gene_type:complete
MNQEILPNEQTIHSNPTAFLEVFATYGIAEAVFTEINQVKLEEGFQALVLTGAGVSSKRVLSCRKFSRYSVQRWPRIPKT